MTGALRAPAKVNLWLNVVGRRADGYHLLDSLIAFTDLADEITAQPADRLTLTVDGPWAGLLAGEADNLVLKAARLLADRASVSPRAALHLTKRIPVAAGLGGGSADAAAALRALVDLWRVALPIEELFDLAARLGADVPMCLRSTPLRATGIGEQLQPVSGLPRLPMVLVNPRLAVSTPAVFRALARRDNPSLADLPAAFADVAGLARWLETTRNDLEAPAITLIPAIAEARAAMAATAGCLLARMSGSGATVFGLFPDDASAARAATALASAHPGWWVAATHAPGS